MTNKSDDIIRNIRARKDARVLEEQPPSPNLYTSRKPTSLAEVEGYVDEGPGSQGLYESRRPASLAEVRPYRGNTDAPTTETWTGPAPKDMEALERPYTANPEEDQDAANVFSADFLDPESSDRRTIPVPPDLQALLGTEVSYTPKPGELRDQVTYGTVYPQVRAALARKKMKAAQIAGTPLTPAMLLQGREELEAEARSLTAAWVGETSGSGDVTEPKAIITRSKDTELLAEGILPEREGVVLNALEQAQDVAQAVYAKGLDAVGLREEVSDAIRWVQDSKQPFIKGLVGDDDTLRIPERAGVVPTRAIASMLYPESGWEAGGWNLFHKAAQDIFYPFIAVGEAQKKILDKKLEAGEEVGFFDFLEAREQALSDPSVIDNVRSNRATFDVATDDDVRSATVPLWLAVKALSGENIYELSEKHMMVELRNAFGLGHVVQGAQLLGPKAQYHQIRALIEGVQGENFLEAREQSLKDSGYWDAKRLESTILGPMTAAVISPDMFVGGVKAAGLAWKGFKGVRGSVYAAQVTKDIDILEKLLSQADAAIAAGKKLKLPNLKETGLSTNLRVQLSEAMRGVVVKGDKESLASISTLIKKNMEKSRRFRDALGESVAGNVPSRTTEAGRKALLAAADLRQTQAGRFIPRAWRSGAKGSTARVSAWGREAGALQHRAFALRLTEETLGLQLKSLESFGLIGKGGKSIPGSVGAARAELKAAAEAFQAAALKGDAVAVRKLANKMNKAFTRLAQNGSDQGTEAIRLLQAAAKAKADKAMADLQALATHAVKDGVQEAASVNSQIVRMEESLAKALDPAAKALLGNAQKAQVAATLRTAIEGLHGARETMSLGRLMAPKGAPLPVDFAAFEALATPAEKVSYIKAMVNSETFAKLPLVPEGKMILAGADLTPVEASNLMRWTASQGAKDSLSAWSLSAYTARARGSNIMNDAALSGPYKALAVTEAFFSGLKTSGLRRYFQFVASEDVYNAGRLGRQANDMGLSELGDVVAAASKAPGANSADTISKVRLFLEASPNQALGPFGQAGREAPLQEALRFFRTMSPKTMRDQMSFRVMARSLLTSGQQTGDATNAMMKALEKLVLKSETTPVAYKDIAKELSAAGKTAAVNADTNVKAHMHLASGIINASAQMRMLETLAVQQLGFDTKTLMAAQRLATNSGSQTVRRETFNRAAEVRALSESMGISFENLRKTVRGLDGGGQSWGLVLARDSKDGLQAVVPRPMMEKLGNEVAWMLKATDSGKPVALSLEPAKFFASVDRALRFARRSMTSGILFPKPSYFVNNIHGAATQVMTSADMVSALRATLGAGATLQRWGSKIKGGLSFLNTGHKALDARMVEAARNGVVKGQRHATKTPSPIAANSNPLIRSLLDDALMPPEQAFRTSTGEALTKRQLIKEMMTEGVFESKAKSFLMETNQTRSKGSGLRGAWSQAMEKTEFWAGAMDDIERSQRMGLYLDQRLRKGVRGTEAGALVREAYFDWAYPPALLMEASMSRVPVFMFASMWKNAATHTLSALADPTKAYRMMNLYKAHTIGANALSSGDTENHRLPWYASKTSQAFITADADEAQALQGFTQLGAETGNLAIPLPEMISIGLMLTTVNAALSTAYALRRRQNEPETRDGWHEARSVMVSTISRFMDPYILYAAGKSESVYGGEYDGPIRLKPVEVEAIMAMEDLQNRTGFGVDMVSRTNLEFKQDRATGATKAVGDMYPVVGMRLLPGFNRIARAMTPLVDKELGSDSASYFDKAVKMGLAEAGRAPVHVPTEAAAIQQRQKILDAKIRGIE